MSAVDPSNAAQNSTAEAEGADRSASLSSSRCGPPSRRTWRLGWQAVAAGYLLVLTLLLVHPDAFALFGMGAKSVEKQVDVTVPGMLQHFTAYVLLGILLSVGFAGPRFTPMSILLFALLHGATTESIQAFVPNRTADWWDLLANTSGAMLSVACCWWLRGGLWRRLPQAGICVLLACSWGCSSGDPSGGQQSQRETAPAADATAPAAPKPLPPAARFVRPVAWMGEGQWIKVETHCHTKFSDGAHTIEEVVAKASEHGCDAVAITDHIDCLDREDIPGYLAAIDLARRQFPGLLVLVGLEWNIPPSGGDDHATVLFPATMADAATLVEFCEQFDDYSREEHDAALTTRGLDWLEDRVGADGVHAVVSLNHPTRKFFDSEEVYDFFIELAGPSQMLVGFSGAPGHQAGRVNGAYDGKSSTVDRWDPVVRTGDTWDRLLQSGRDVWAALAPCDFHRHGGDEWGDYWPGEFSETWVFVPERSPAGVLRGLKAGTCFASHGGIVREAELSVDIEGLDRPAHAGEAVEVPAGTKVRIHFAAQVPQQDLFGEPNRIDEVEFITVDEAGAESYSITPAGGADIAADHEVLVGAGALAIRVRGRRRIEDGPDLMFYTNPVRVTTAAKSEK